jgi:hypothetical protein
MLEWLDEQPRGYAETIERWKTSCPRLSIWEDAIADGFVRMNNGAVQVTERGRAAARSPATRPAAG